MNIPDSILLRKYHLEKIRLHGLNSIDTGNAKHIYHKTEEEHKFDKSPDPRMLKAAIESLRTYKTRREQESSLVS